MAKVNFHAHPSIAGANKTKGPMKMTTTMMMRRKTTTNGAVKAVDTTRMDTVNNLATLVMRIRERRIGVEQTNLTQNFLIESTLQKRRDKSISKTCCMMKMILWIALNKLRRKKEGSM
jgi:hypothetical protein